MKRRNKLIQRLRAMEWNALTHHDVDRADIMRAAWLRILD